MTNFDDENAASQERANFYQKISNQQFTVDELKRLAVGADFSTQYYLAGSTDLPQNILDEYSTHTLETIRLRVAQNPNTHPDSLKRLMQDPVDKILLHVALNPSATAEVLAVSYPYQGQILRTVVDHPNVPEWILEEQAVKSDDGYVIQNIIFNRNCTPKIIELLQTTSVGEEIVAAKTKDVDLIVRLMKSRRMRTKIRLSENRKTPEEALRKLSGYKNIQVKQGLAMNSSTPTDILEKLWDENNTEMHASFAYNSSTPKHILEELMNVESRAIKSSAAKNLKEYEPYNEWPDEWFEAHFEVSLDYGFLDDLDF